MITTANLIKGLSEWIEYLFGEPPVTKDVQEEFTRPSTYLTPTDINVARENGLKKDEITIEIVRFSENSYSGYIDLVNYQDTLSTALLNPIKITDTFFIYPENVEYELDRNEMYLQVTFTIENFQTIVDTNETSVTFMQTLNLNKEVE